MKLITEYQSFISGTAVLRPDVSKGKRRLHERVQRTQRSAGRFTTGEPLIITCLLEVDEDHEIEL